MIKTILPFAAGILLLASSTSAHADDPGAVAPQTSVPVAPAVAVAAASPPSPVLVPIDSTRAATVLEKLQTSEEDFHFDLPTFPYDKGTWAVVCVTPCRIPLDGAALYRVKAFNGVSASSAFTIPRGIGSIHVDAGSQTMSRVGRFLAAVGAVVAVSAGGAALADDRSSTRTPALVAAGGGVVAVITGAVLWALSPSQTKFE